MIRFATLIARLATPGADRATAIAAYLALVPAADADAALTLLSGQRPHRAATPADLRNWALAEAGLPDWLFEASRAVTGDAAETLALLIPPPLQPTRLTLAESLHAIANLPAASDAAAVRAEVVRLWRCTLPDERALLNRLIGGTFRTRIDPATLARAQSGQPAPTTAPRRSLLAVLVYAEAATPTGSSGPELTLALWQGADLIPVARLRAALPASDIGPLLAWVRSTTIERYGPLRRVPGLQVFRLGYDEALPNARRKSGLTLTYPHLLAWVRDAPPDAAAHLADLRAAALAQPAPLPLDALNKPNR